MAKMAIKARRLLMVATLLLTFLSSAVTGAKKRRQGARHGHHALAARGKRSWHKEEGNAKRRKHPGQTACTVPAVRSVSRAVPLNTLFQDAISQF